MELEIDIKIYLKFTLENGFKITESKDFGMAKVCRLEYPILNMEICYDRFEYYATIEYNEKNYNVVHLANFLNKEKPKYKFFDFGFETREIDAERFLTQLDEIMKSNFDNVLDFLFKLSAEKQAEFDNYCEKINTELRGW